MKSKYLFQHFDFNSIISNCSKNKKSQESKSDYYYPSNAPKKKKQSTEQCKLDENITHQINEKFASNAVKKLVKTALDNPRVKQEYQRIKK